VTTTLVEEETDGQPSMPSIIWCERRTAELTLRAVANITTLGRDSSASMVLEGQAQSRAHAEIRKEGPIHSLRDLGSRNGTFVNGGLVDHSVLQRGDVIRIGEWVGLFGDFAAGEERFSELAPGLFGGAALARSLQGTERAARAGLSVAIEGETGTGKELVARAIHHWSERSGRFCAVNCAAVPAGLAESEFFGFKKGAFTGAERAAPGYFRNAQHGSLLLDEVAELPSSLQAKLLRVLQERAVVPLGEQDPIPVDVQIVCAAQASLRALAEAGQFRLDLATRLSGFALRLPPLRERRPEILPLFCHFLRRFGRGTLPTFDAKVVESLWLYAWPGNVRELEQVARHIQALHGEEPLLRRAQLPEYLQRAVPSADGPAARVEGGGPLRTRRSADQERLASALRDNAGNVTRSAKQLGFSRQRAYRLLSGGKLSTNDGTGDEADE
jgi:DNA-binding NtrC family response regulator